MDNLRNIFVSLMPSSPAFYFAASQPTALTIITSIVLPIVFFAIGKTIDVLVQIYLKKKALESSSSQK